MTEKEVAKLLLDMQSWYPMRNIRVDEDVVRAWHKDLQDEDKEEVRRRFRYHRKNSTYTPTIADLLGNTENTEEVSFRRREITL